MKIFISCPFSGILDKETNLVKDEYRYFFNGLTDFLKLNNVDFYLAITKENWGLDYISPEDSTKNDYDGVKDCDVLFVIPGNPISGGVHIELGWASSLRKRIHIFMEDKANYSPVVMGLSSLTETFYHTSSFFPSKELLKDIISEIEEEISK